MSTLMDPNLKLYQITNGNTDQARFIADYTRQGACDTLGWDIKLCRIVEYSGKRSKSQYPAPQAELTTPCFICPFQYAECQKPSLKFCPIRLECPDYASWLEQTKIARKCPHIGQELNAFDYLYHQRRTSSPNNGHRPTPQGSATPLIPPPPV